MFLKVTKIEVFVNLYAHRALINIQMRICKFTHLRQNGKWNYKICYLS
jgi:hypothetical protein